MNHASEHDIDRVLTALRDTEPSEGMERRILQALESRTPAPSAWFRWTSPMQWSLAALATAALIFAVALTVHNSRRSAPSIAQSPMLTPSQNPVLSTQARPSPSVIATGAQPPLVISTGAQRSGEIAAFPEASATHTPALLKSAGSTQPAYPPHELLCDCDRLAMAEMQAPSHPSPVMPLTAQERLLQRVVHNGEPMEVAELESFEDHKFRAAAPAKEEDAVKGAVQSFLRRLAAAETLNPTAPTPTPTSNATPDTSSNDPDLPVTSPGNSN